MVSRSLAHAAAEVGRANAGAMGAAVGPLEHSRRRPLTSAGGWQPGRALRPRDSPRLADEGDRESTPPPSGNDRLGNPSFRPLQPGSIRGVNLLWVSGATLAHRRW